MERPRKFDSLYTLNVWTTYGNLMVKLFELNYRERYPYTVCDILHWEESRKYVPAEILKSLAEGADGIALCLNDKNKRNNFVIRGTVISATPNEMDRSSWILVLKGELDNQRECWTEATVVAYYDTESGRGFCLVPDQQMALIGR